MTEGWQSPANAPLQEKVLLALDTGQIVVGYWSPDPSPSGAWFFEDGLNSIDPPPLAWMRLPPHPGPAPFARDGRR